MSVMRQMSKRLLSRCASVSIMRCCTPPMMKSFVAITSFIFFVPIVRLLRSAHKIPDWRRVCLPYGTRDELVKKESQRVHEHSDDVKQKERMQKLCTGSRPLSHALYGNRRKSGVFAKSLKSLRRVSHIIVRLRHFVCNKRRRNKPRAAGL